MTSCPSSAYGYQSNSVNKIFSENNGTAFDKSLLLSSYLKLANLNSTLILISKYNNFSIKVPSLLQFDNFAVLCKDSLNKIYLNPIHEQKNNYKFDIIGKTIFDFNNSEMLTKIEKDTTVRNIQKLDLKINIKNDLTLNGNYKLIYGEIYNPYYELYKDEKNAKTVAKKVINGKIDNSKIDGMNQAKSILTGKFNSNDTLKIKDNYIRYELPQFSQSFNNCEFNVSKTNRKTPFNLQNKFCEKYSYEIDIPKNFECINPDTIIERKNEIGKLIIKFKNEDNKLVVMKKLTINKSSINPMEYKNFRKIIVLWQNPNYNKIVLRKINDKKLTLTNTYSREKSRN